MSQNRRVADWIPTDQIYRDESIVAQSDAPPGAVPITDAIPAATSGVQATGARLDIQPNQPSAPRDGDTWIDLSNPAAPSIKVYSNTQGAWVIVSMLPAASVQGETIVAGAAPDYEWAAGNIDGSRY